MYRSIFLLFLAFSCLHQPTWLHAAEPDEPITIKIVAAETPAIKTQYRFLPADSELRDGDAAVVLLRIIWEQQGFMRNVLPNLRKWTELAYDDPNIPNLISFDGFTRKLRRAAYIRNANWNYPFDEEPHATILLPDVQGLRAFLVDGMKLWVGNKIAVGDLEAAREGILIQLAGARHIARTPVMVNHLIANAITDSAFGRAEIMLGHPDCPNLYWAFAMLPRTSGNYRDCLNWESNMLENSLMSLTDPHPPIDDPAWRKIADEFSTHMGMEMGRQGLDVTEAALLMVRMDAIARRDLVAFSQFPIEDVERMKHEEAIMRWVLFQTRLVNAEIEAAFNLPAPQALHELGNVETRVAEMMQSTGAPEAPFTENPVSLYLSMFRFERRVKLLQVVEALRHHLSRSGGQLPTSLAQIKPLHVPNDPFTESPFEYELTDGVAHLKTPRIPGISEELNAAAFREYRIEVAAE